MISLSTLKCIDFSPCPLLLNSPLSQKHWRHEILDDRILRNLISFSLQFDPMIRQVCQFRFRTMSVLIQATRKTNIREGICEHISQLPVNNRAMAFDTS